ncbi:hypothetical protein RSAG8_03783, partial [Rhizoctonia solani AG-8 WAC10335]
MTTGCGGDVCINVLLSLLAWIPGVIHAFMVISKHKEHRQDGQLA